MEARPNESIDIFFQAPYGENNLYPQAVILDSSGNVKATINGSHLSGGSYSGTGTAPDKGYYIVRKKFYTDSGHTVFYQRYGTSAELLEVSYGQRVAFGGAGGISAEDIKKSFLPILERLDEIDKRTKKIEETQFDASKDIVKTEIKPVSLIALKEEIKKQNEQFEGFRNSFKWLEKKTISLEEKLLDVDNKIIQIKLPEQLNYTNDFQIIQKDLEKIKKKEFPDFSQYLTDLKNSFLSLEKKISVKPDISTEVFVEENKKIFSQMEKLEGVFKNRNGFKLIFDNLKLISFQLSENVKLFQQLNREDKKRLSAFLQALQMSWQKVINLLEKIANKQEITFEDILEANSYLLKAKYV